MIWLVGIEYKSLEWPNGLARASRQSVRVAVRIPMNTRIATLGVNLLPSLRRTIAVIVTIIGFSEVWLTYQLLFKRGCR
jgi:hypothetical protein